MHKVSELPSVSRDTPVCRIPNAVTYADRRRSSPIRRRVRRPHRRRASYITNNVNQDDSDGDYDPFVIRQGKNQRFPSAQADSRISNTTVIDEASSRPTTKQGCESKSNLLDHRSRRANELPTNEKPLQTTTITSRPQSRPKQERSVMHSSHQSRRRRESVPAKLGTNNQGEILSMESQLSPVNKNIKSNDVNHVNSSILANYTGGDREELVKSSLTLRLQSQLLAKKESEDGDAQDKKRCETPPSSSRAITRFKGRLLSVQRPKSCFGLLSSRLFDGGSLTSIASEEFHELAATKDSDEDRESEEFDTDCEPDVNSEFRHQEYVRSMTQQDSDIGHITYELVCDQMKIKPRAKVKQQLRERCLDLRHGGLLPQEAKAISTALQANSRVEQVDLSHNALPGKAVGFIAEVISLHIYITKLNLSGNVVDEDGANACCTMLVKNCWLTELDISECAIGDNESSLLSQGIQENRQLRILNLSKNRIGLTGGLVLGRALGMNDGLKKVDLSWNHIRGGGAVSICNSLKKNTSLEELNLAWNGIGFEGSLALGEALRLNRTLKYLNLENNRINWDCAPYLTRALMANKALEVLVIGQNPISMEGCEDIMMALTKPTSGLKSISFAGIPINTRIALIATDISKTRSFSMDHGGILSTADVIGIHRSRREDPFTLLIRYLSLMGIRVMDLFRMFDKDNKHYVSRSKFIQGLKRVRVPLDDDDILIVAKRLQSNRHGHISYQKMSDMPDGIRKSRKLKKFRCLCGCRRQAKWRNTYLVLDHVSDAFEHFLYNLYDGCGQAYCASLVLRELATTVRNHIREDRMEDRRQKIIQKKKLEERKRILESGKPLTPSNMNCLPSLYNMYDRNERAHSSRVVFSPSLGTFSRRGYNYTSMPLISTDKEHRMLIRSSEGRRRTLSGLPQPGKSYLTQSVTFSGHSSVASESGRSSSRKVLDVGSPYVSQLKKQHTNDFLSLPRQL